jgi:hypothetical protein
VSDQVNGQVLAYCSQCEIPFPFAKAHDGSFGIGLPGQSLYIGSMTLGSDGLQIEGSTATCPRCGNMASIPDGSYKFIRDNIRLIRGLTREDASTTVEVLRQIQAGVDASNELLEGLPEQTRELIAKAQKSENFRFLISALLALLLYFASTRATGQLTSDDQHLTSEVQQLSTEVRATNEYERCLVEQLGPMIREMNSQSVTGKEQVAQRSIRKTDPCWCGSRRKFQKCHGREK